MRTPNYALALALSAADWSNAEVARRLNDGAVRRGYRGIAIDSARVGRWIRDSERPRPPLPRLIACLLTEYLGESHTVQSLCLTRPRSVRIVLEESDYANPPPPGRDREPCSRELCTRPDSCGN